MHPPPNKRREAVVSVGGGDAKGLRIRRRRDGTGAAAAEGGGLKLLLMSGVTNCVEERLKILRRNVVGGAVGEGEDAVLHLAAGAEDKLLRDFDRELAGFFTIYIREMDGGMGYQRP